MTWQDWCTIIGTILSIVGLILSIVTIVIAGGIKRAVINEKTLSRYRIRRQHILNDISKLLKTLSDVKQPNNYHIQNFGIITQELESFSKQWASKDRKNIKSANLLYNDLYLKHKEVDDKHINIICDYLSKFTIILSKEEYY